VIGLISCKFSKVIWTGLRSIGYNAYALTYSTPPRLKHGTRHRSPSRLVRAVFRLNSRWFTTFFNPIDWSIPIFSFQVFFPLFVPSKAVFLFHVIPCGWLDRDLLRCALSRRDVCIYCDRLPFSFALLLIGTCHYNMYLNSLSPQ